MVFCNFLTYPFSSADTGFANDLVYNLIPFNPYIIYLSLNLHLTTCLSPDGSLCTFLVCWCRYLNGLPMSQLDHEIDLGTESGSCQASLKIIVRIYLNDSRCYDSKTWSRKKTNEDECYGKRKEQKRYDLTLFCIIQLQRGERTALYICQVWDKV